MSLFKIISIDLNYTNLQNIEYQLRNKDAMILNSNYTDIVNLEVAINMANFDKEDKWIKNQIGLSIISNYNIIEEKWLSIK